MRQVWIDAWQMQCCGDAFHVGQRVEFSTIPPGDRAFLGRVLGEERAACLTDREDHHDVGGGVSTRIVGSVERIEAVWCRFDVRGHPVAGTTQFALREQADGWEPEDDLDPTRGEPTLGFVGYVVTMETDNGPSA